MNLIFQNAAATSARSLMALVLGSLVQIVGAMGRELARPFSCEAWTDRVMALARNLTGGGEC